MPQPWQAIAQRFCSISVCTIDRLIKIHSFSKQGLMEDRIHAKDYCSKKELIIVLSDFDTGIKSQDLGFTPNETYEGWGS